MKKKIAIVFTILFSIVMAFGIMVLCQWCIANKPKPITHFAKEYADSQEWFDYSYDVEENFDEDNNKRWHITYYISGNAKQEIIGYIKNNEFIYEVIE